MEVKNIVEYHRIPVQNDVLEIRAPLIFAHPNARKMVYFLFALLIFAHSCCAKIDSA